MSLAAVGADYPNKRGPSRRFEIAICTPGEVIRLVREPKNVADENAVAVFSVRGVQIGYLTAERAPLIGSMLSRGREISAVFHRAAKFGCWVRVAFDGERPSIEGLAGPDLVEQHQSWYPDEIYPDE